MSSCAYLARLRSCRVDKTNTGDTGPVVRTDGASLSRTRRSTTTRGTSMQNNQNQPIWNPSTVAGLSVLLTPAFGSYLHASNWRSLGQPERAASSKVWFYVSLLVLAAMAVVTVAFAGRAAAGNEAIRGIVNGGGFVYWLVWYFASGRHQVGFP